jgi:hypothetical protein
MQRRVSYFDVEWSRQDQTGRVRITFDDREFTDLEPLSASELTLICEVLRQGKVVYYDPESDSLTTIAAPVTDANN